jgi:hypothetical protein
MNRSHRRHLLAAALIEVKFCLAPFSILRPKKCLATPRVAAPGGEIRCDEMNQNSDEPNGELTIYPLAFLSE